MRKIPSSRPVDPSLYLHVGPGLSSAMTAATSAGRDAVAALKSLVHYTDASLLLPEVNACSTAAAVSSVLSMHKKVQKTHALMAVATLDVSLINTLLERMYANNQHRDVVIKLHLWDGSVSEHWMSERGYLEDWPFGILDKVDGVSASAVQAA